MRLAMIAKNIVKKMSLIDIAIYKCMLLALGGRIIAALPGFNQLNPLFYILIVLLCHGYLVMKTYHARNETSGFIATALANFHEYSFMDVLAFETGLVIFGMLVYQLVPAMHGINPWFFVTVIAFGMGRIGALWRHQKV